jgi:hypothetical protein
MGRLAFPFSGEWNNADPPITLPGYDFQDIQNMRRRGNSLLGVRGHSAINSSAWNATYKYPRNAFQYKKSTPNAEAHILVQGENAGGTASRVYKNDTAVPSAGDFTATPVHTDDTGAGIGRFANTPQGFLAYVNGARNKLWGGDEFLPLIAYSSPIAIGDDGVVVQPKDISLDVLDLSASRTAKLSDHSFSLVTHLLHFDTTAPDREKSFMVDSGPLPYAGAGVSGHPAVLTPYYLIHTDGHKFGSGEAFFPGDANYSIYLQPASTMEFGASTFSVDWWMSLFPLPASGKQTILSRYDNAYTYWQLYYQPADDKVWFVVKKEVAGGGSSSTLLSLSSNAAGMADNQYHHFALIRGWGGNANAWAITVNGQVNAGNVVTAAITIPSSNQFGTIGSMNDAEPLTTGYMDEFRAQIGAPIQTATFTPPTSAYVPDGANWLIGSPIPLSGLKFYVSSPNTVAAALTVKEYQTAGWASLTFTNGTASGGVPMAHTGLLAWAATGAASPVYINGNSLYWYQVSIDGNGADADIYGITATSDFEDVPNLWDGEENAIAAALAIAADGTVTDVTTVLQAPEKDYDAPLGGVSSDTFYVASGVPIQGMFFYLDATNAHTTTLHVAYWNGNTWIEPDNVSDGTIGYVPGVSDPVPFYKSGPVTWAPPAYGEEQPNLALSTDAPLYWYKFSWDNDLSETPPTAYHLLCLPYNSPLPAYTFPITFRNRLFLFNESGGDHNKGKYSASGEPWVFNGGDSGELTFGDGNPVTTAAALYNVYVSTGVHQLIVTTAGETFRLEGTGPADWKVERVTGATGCIAPLSMAVCGVAPTPGSNASRQVLIWLGATGVYMCDGASVQRISDPIRAYFDPSYDDCIASSTRAAAKGEYDPVLNSYKLLVGGIELEYSLEYGVWTKLYRENATGANPLTAIFRTADASGGEYMLGATDEGIVYLLEDGDDWNGVADIDEFVWIKDLMLDDEAPFFNDALVSWLRLLMTKRTGSGDAVSFTVYGNGQAITTYNRQEAPGSTTLDAGPVYTTDVNLGPFHHISFKIRCVTSTAGGMQLNGLGLVFGADQFISQ